MEGSRNGGEPGDLLIIVIDCNPFWWGKNAVAAGGEDRDSLWQCLDSVLALANAHLVFHADNDVAIIACYNSRTKWLSYQEPRKSVASTSTEILNGAEEDESYGVFPNGDALLEENSNSAPDTDLGSASGLRDGKLERLSTMNDHVTLGLKAFVKENSEEGGVVGAGNDSVVAGALAMALCYINKRQRLLHPDTSSDFSSFSSSSSSRILIVKGADDCSSQYLNLMNSVFTAQRLNVIVDSCVLGKVSSLLQQAADITGGICLQAPSLAGLTQYLLWVFLPRPSLRPSLSLPPSARVDYRAACFCHRNLIDVGFVCSVCLSIFCSFSPICSTCHTTFKMPLKIAGSKKSKKTS